MKGGEEMSSWGFLDFPHIPVTTKPQRDLVPLERTLPNYMAL